MSLIPRFNSCKVNEDHSQITISAEETVIYSERTYSEIAKTSLQYLAKVVGFLSLEIILNRAIFYLTADHNGPRYNCSIQHSLLQRVGNLCSYLYPSKIESAICSLFPRITIHHEIADGQITKPYLLHTIFCAAMEELVFRKVIQQVALPAISKILPAKCDKLLNNKVFRILSTSTLFALAHTHYFQWPQGVMLPFKTGLLCGALVETEGSIVLPSTIYFLANILHVWQAIQVSDWHHSKFSLHLP